MSVSFDTGAGVATRMTGWRLATVALAVAAVVLVAGYWQTVQSLVWVWAHDGTYQYAFLIFPLCAWMVFALRHRLRAHPPVPSLWGLAAVLVLVCIWYVGHAMAVNLLQHFAFVALFPALVLACWGWRALWTLKFPLGYLVVFAVPWGDGMVGPLQDVTAHIAVRALDLTGTPVLLNGREILTPTATWMVAEACSGVKFFFACTALGCLYAWLMYRRGWKRVTFVLLAAVVPIIANGLRVYFTILIGETWGMEYATGTDHLIFGWQFFGAVLLLLLVAGWYFRDPVENDAPAPARPGRPLRMRRGVWPAALVLLVAGPVMAAVPARVAAPQRLDVAAPVLAGWHGPQAARGGWHPVFAGAAGQVQATYRPVAGGEAVALFHAVYAGRPRRGHSLITFGNTLYRTADARLLSTAEPQVVLADGSEIAAGELRLSEAAGERLVWYWYCVDGRCTASPVWTKLLLTWAVLRGGEPRSSVWALSVRVARHQAGPARAALHAFARALPGTRASIARRGRAVVATGARP